MAMVRGRFCNLMGVWYGCGSVLFIPQQAILNRVSGSAVQEGVTAAAAIGFIVQVVGLALAGQIDR